MSETTNYSLTKPAIDSVGWGSDVNANFDTIDAQMKSNADAAASALSSANSKVPITRTVNSKALSSNIVLTTADVADSSNKRYVTDANLVVIGNTSGTNTGDQTLPTDATLSFTDVTTNNASSTKHGFLPKLDNTGTKYLRDDGTWQTVSAGASLTKSTFTNASLSTGVLTITHNLGLASNAEVLMVTILNNSKKQIIPDDITFSANSFAVDLTSYGTLSGTWQLAYIA
jgi:hypothetical protein